jgi:hypothetical protein
MTNSPDLRREGLDFGWRVHGALDAWTGKVDTKASIALALESAIFGFVVSRTDDGRQFDALSGVNECWFYGGLVLVLAAALFALAAVMPQLNRRQSRQQWRSNMIYFGHLRHWDPADLQKALVVDLPQEEQLARQLVAMSKIAWRKHAALQYSLWALLLGVSCLLLAT